MRRSRPTLSSLSGIAFVVMLALALAFTGRDGAIAPDDGDVTAAGLFASAAAPDYVYGRALHALTPFMTAASDIAPPGPPIPTAHPAELLIPALDVHRAVESVGVSRSGVLNLPVNAWNAGWYQGSPVPGAPGDSVIEGHAGYPDHPMIFGRLINLKRGDQIIVVLADGTRQLFLVDSMRSVPVGSAPAGLALPYGPPRLTLITCTGHFDQKTYSYSSRLVLEASYAGPA